MFFKVTCPKCGFKNDRVPRRLSNWSDSVSLLAPETCANCGHDFSFFASIAPNGGPTPPLLEALAWLLAAISPIGIFAPFFLLSVMGICHTWTCDVPYIGTYVTFVAVATGFSCLIFGLCILWMIAAVTIWIFAIINSCIVISHVIEALDKRVKSQRSE